MMKRKFSVYIRRLHKGDYEADLITGIQLNCAKKLGLKYVLVQRYHPHRILALGTSKLDIKRRCRQR